MTGNPRWPVRTWQASRSLWSLVRNYLRLDSQRTAFDRVGDALRGDGNGPDDDVAAGVFVAV
ncbi:hypothetical protein [Streptomyces zhihengii]